MSDMETDLTSLRLCYSLPDYSSMLYPTGKDKRRKQKDPKRKAKEFPDLTDDDALVEFQNEHDELSSQKEQKLGELALSLPCPVLDCPGNAKISTKQNDPPEPSAKKPSRLQSRDTNKTTNDDRGFVSPKKTAKKLKFSVPIAGTSQPVNVQNKFSSLSEKEAETNPTTSDQTAAPISGRPKSTPNYV
ncbi:hypothetical protein TNCV_2871591 [Trichonephila clavipes]|nr:hypothetical protein TNCV_2871591 [Trichonephila clavipes]